MSGKFSRALTLFEAGRIADAIPLLEKSLKKNPGNTKGLYTLGVCYFRLREFARAQNIFSRVVSQDEENYLAHYYRGLSLERQGRLNDALRDYRVANAINPNFDLAVSKLRNFDTLDKQHSKKRFSSKAKPPQPPSKLKRKHHVPAKQSWFGRFLRWLILTPLKIAIVFILFAILYHFADDWLISKGVRGTHFNLGSNTISLPDLSVLAAVFSAMAAIIVIYFFKKRSVILLFLRRLVFISIKSIGLLFLWAISYYFMEQWLISMNATGTYLPLGPAIISLPAAVSSFLALTSIFVVSRTLFGSKKVKPEQAIEELGYPLDYPEVNSSISNSNPRALEEELREPISENLTTRDHVPSASPPTEEKRCPTCKGKGFVYKPDLGGMTQKREVCPQCQGKKTITVESRIQEMEKAKGKLIKKGHRSMMSYGLASLSFVVFFILAFVFPPYIFIAIVFLIYCGLGSLSTLYEVYEKRVDISQGILFRQHRTIWFYQITDISVTRNFTQLGFDNATINILAAGVESNAEFLPRFLIGVLDTFFGWIPIINLLIPENASPMSTYKSQIIGLGTVEETKELYEDLKERVLNQRVSRKRHFV